MLEESQQKPEQKIKNRKLAPLLSWIFFGAFVAALFLLGIYSIVPLVLGALVAYFLYRLTKKLIRGRILPVRIVAWVLMVVASLGIYNFIWWEWGPLMIQYGEWRIEWQERQRLARDTIGGETPQETYEAFLSYLRGNDLETAARYFHGRGGEKWLERINFARAPGEKEYLIQRWPEWNELRLVEESINKSFYFSMEEKTYAWEECLESPQQITDFDGEVLTLPPGCATSTIVFVLNPVSKVWKIW